MNPSGRRTSSLVHAAQRAYVERLAERQRANGLIVAEAFVRGVRDIGYRSTATAIDELIDNALQAEATKIAIAFGTEEPSKKPSAVAVIDDGHGIVPEMLPLAIAWGGTHREGDRSGFGRYGYGLPSACVSQGRRFTVFSKIAADRFHAVSLDVDEIARGEYLDRQGHLITPAAVATEPPGWVIDAVRSNFPRASLRHGTIVLIEKLDRVSRTTAPGLQRLLVDHIGITYRNLLGLTRITVHETDVEPIDPLFLTPGCRYYDLDDDRARALDPIAIQVTDPDSGAVIGTLRVRYALFPTTFASVDKQRPAFGRNANARLAVMRDHNGIVFLRMGRQIDIVTSGLGRPFQNNDRYWKAEVDFSADLDEYFGVNTSKQRIEVSDFIWDVLRAHGMEAAINQLRTLNSEARSSTLRPAIIDTRAASPMPSLDGRLDGHQVASHRVDLVTVPGGPFIQPKLEGGTVVLLINTAHRFFTNLYAAKFDDPRMRGGLEALLLTLIESDLPGTDTHGVSAEPRLSAWSRRLDRALEQLENRLDPVRVRRR